MLLKHRTKFRSFVESGPNGGFSGREAPLTLYNDWMRCYNRVKILHKSALFPHKLLGGALSPPKPHSLNPMSRRPSRPPRRLPYTVSAHSLVIYVSLRQCLWQKVRNIFLFAAVSGCRLCWWINGKGKPSQCYGASPAMWSTFATRHR